MFFGRSGPTETIWYYEHPLPDGRKNYTKTKPLRYSEFKPLLNWWHKREENEHAWKVPVNDVLQYDQGGKLLSANLDINNPHVGDEFEHLPPDELLAGIIQKEKRVLELLSDIQTALGEKQ